MNREECENQILEKLKEIKDIAKNYDKSEVFYLSLTIYNDSMLIGNAHWKTETPLDAIAYNDGKVIHFDN